VPASAPHPATTGDLLAQSQRHLDASEEALAQGNLAASAPLAYEALRSALSAALLRHGFPAVERGSLLAQAERLGKAARLDCVAPKIAPLLCLGLDPRDATRDPVRLARLLSAAHGITRTLQALAVPPGAPSGSAEGAGP
jgi:hypothetical protein